MRCQINPTTDSMMSDASGNTTAAKLVMFPFWVPNGLAAQHLLFFLPTSMLLLSR
jgi:hypothetical protein